MDNYKSPNRFSILASQDSEEEPKLVEGKSQARATRKCSDIVADAMSLRINLKNMMRNESLDRDFARFLRTETKSFTAELLRVDKNPDPFSPSKMASLEARIRSLKGLSPVIKEAKKATAEEILINKEEDEQENSPGEKSPSRASKLRHVSGNQRSQELFRDAASVRSDLLRAACDSSVDRKCSKAAVEVADSIENEVKLAKASEKKEISESNKEEARGVCASEHLSGDDAEVSDEGESEDEVSSEEINTAEAEAGITERGPRSSCCLSSEAGFWFRGSWRRCLV
ncbi:hypothetical protein U1Q18_040566 [Sarracenia purpurea var. burkii]